MLVASVQINKFPDEWNFKEFVAERIEDGVMNFRQGEMWRFFLQDHLERFN